MPTQAIIPVTPGSGLNLDSVSLVIGPATVYRETMVIADPSNATYLATVTSGGALNVTDAAVEACITADVLAVSLPTAQITTLTPPSAADIASAIVSNPPTTFDGIVTNAGTFAVQDQHTSAGAAGYQYLTDGTNVIGVSAHPLYVQGTISIGSGPFAVTQSTSPWIVAGGGTAGSSGTAVLTIQGIGGGTAVPVSGTFYQATQPVSIASGQVASGAFASGSIASGAIASGAIAAGAAAAGAFADGSVYVRSNAAATFPVTATIAAAQTIAVTNAGTFAVQATLSAETTKVIGTVNQGTSPWVDNISQWGGTNVLTGGVNGSVGVGGLAAAGAAASGNPVLIGGIDQSGNVQLAQGYLASGHFGLATANAVTGTDAITNYAILMALGINNGSGPAGIAPFVFNGTTWDRARSGGATGSTMVAGAVASGSAVGGNPVLVGGSDGTDARSLLTDTSGRLKVDVLGNAGATVDAAINGAAPTNAVWTSDAPSTASATALTPVAIAAAGKTVLKATAGNLYGIVCSFTTTLTDAILYVQFWNCSNTTLANFVMSFPVLTSTALGAGLPPVLSIPPGAFALANFSTGITIALSTTLSSTTTTTSGTLQGTVFIL